MQNTNSHLNKNTFIAFAAAPGGYAYDGKGRMSPFTQALINNMEAVDLPLFNLMSRVRQEVLSITASKQRTWDNSSLTAPFFFNPGSLLLFFGNLMALFGLILSFVPYSLVLASGEGSWEKRAAAAALPVISLAILLFGMQNAYSRLRGNFKYVGKEKTGIWDHLILSSQKGGIGGYLGAQLAALWISVPYYLSWAQGCADSDIWEPPLPLGILTVEIAVAAAFVACTLGFICIFLARVGWSKGRLKLIDHPGKAQILASTACGGMLTGLIAAPALMAYFGRLDRPEVTPDYLLPGSIIGASIVVFSIVNFDFERLNARRMGASALAAGAALMCGALATAIVFGPLYAFGIVQKVIVSLEQQFDNPVVMISGAAAYGLPVGLILGIVIGTAIVLTEKWSGRSVL